MFLRGFSPVPFQFTPVTGKRSLFSPITFSRASIFKSNSIRPSVRYYYSQLSTLQTCHCSPVAIELRYPTRWAEIGIDGQEPDVVPPAFRIIPTETFLSLRAISADTTNRADRAPAFGGDFFTIDREECRP